MTGAAWGFLLTIAVRWLLGLRLARIGQQVGSVLYDLAHPPAPIHLRGLPLLFAVACAGLLLRSRLAGYAAAWLAYLIGGVGLGVASLGWVGRGQGFPWVALVYLAFGIAVHRRLRTPLFLPGHDYS
jgi:hypothetical protein